MLQAKLSHRFIVALVFSVLLLSILSPKLTEAATLSTDQLVYADINGIYLTSSSLANKTTILNRTTAGLSELRQGIVLSPDRQFVYFQVKDVPYPSSMASIYRMDVDGTNIQDLGYDLPENLFFDGVLSPDGRRIAYWSLAGKIAIRNIDGSGSISEIQARDVSTPPITFVRWLGSDHLAFGINAAPSAGTCGMILKSINVDGTGSLSLTPDNSSLPVGSCDSIHNYITPTADGTKIAYVKRPASNPSLYKLYVLNADGSGTEEEVFTAPTHTFGSSTTYGSINYTSWSRDQQNIVMYYRNPPTGSQAGSHLGVLNIATETLVADRYIATETTGHVGVAWQ